VNFIVSVIAFVHPETIQSFLSVFQQCSQSFSATSEISKNVYWTLGMCKHISVKQKFLFSRSFLELLALILNIIFNKNLITFAYYSSCLLLLSSAVSLSQTKMKSRNSIVVPYHSCRSIVFNRGCKGALVRIVLKLKIP
jgi:hypothetical protein